jgi:hypothetical protein
VQNPAGVCYGTKPERRHKERRRQASSPNASQLHQSLKTERCGSTEGKWHGERLETHAEAVDAQVVEVPLPEVLPPEGDGNAKKRGGANHFHLRQDGVRVLRVLVAGAGVGHLV